MVDDPRKEPKAGNCHSRWWSSNRPIQIFVGTILVGSLPIYGKEWLGQYWLAKFPPKQAIEKLVKPPTSADAKLPEQSPITGSIKPAKPQPTAETKCLRDQNAALIANRRSMDEAKAAFAKCKIDYKAARYVWTEETAETYCASWTKHLIGLEAVGLSIETWCSMYKPSNK